MTCDEARDSLAALSLDALDPEERATVEAHVAACLDCTTELRGYLEAAEWLARSVPQREPPTALKERVLTAARPDRQAVTVAHRSLWALSGLRLQPTTLAAALALVMALGTTLWAARLQVQVDEQRAIAATLRERASRYDRVVAVLGASEMQIRPMQGTELAPTANGRLYVDPETGSGMVMVRALPPLPAGRNYQLWWVRPDGRRESGGLLTWTDPQGNAYSLVQCPAPWSTFQSVGFTEEPAGGSPAPTGQRLLGGAI